MLGDGIDYTLFRYIVLRDTVLGGGGGTVLRGRY